MRWSLAVLAAALLAGPAFVMAAGPNPEIGFVPNNPEAALDNRNTTTYTFPLNVEAAQGDSAVHLELSYQSLAQGAIAPASIIRISPQNQVSQVTTIGALQGFSNKLVHANLQSGVYQIEVTATVAGAATGDHRSFLVLLARDPNSASSSPAVAYPFTFHITNRAPTAVSFSHQATHLSVSFTGGATDPEEGPMSFAWNFGDGVTATGASPSHTYAEEGEYMVTVTAADDAGATSSFQKAITVTAPNPPPTKVENLRANATSTSSIEVRWNASTGTGTLQYEVYRSQTSGFTPGTGNLIATQSGTALNNTNLPAGTTQHYRVRAIDSQGVKGAFSEQASATTHVPADTIPPTAPTNLRAHAASDVSISLRWDPASDNQPGQLTYRISRDGQVRGETTGLTFTDYPLAASTTYTYTVVAIDALGNVGPAATLATSTTAPQPPGPPPASPPPASPPPAVTPPPATTPPPAASSSSSSSASSTSTSTAPPSTSSSSTSSSTTTTTAPQGPPAGIRDVTVTTEDGAATITWSTDRPATTTITVGGSTRTFPEGVQFTATFTGLADGPQGYTITATTASGRTSSLQGTFVLDAQQEGSQQQADGELSDALADETGIDVAAGSLFVQRDADGFVTGITDASGTLEQQHVVPEEGLVLLEASNGVFVLVDVAANTVVPVEPLRGVVEQTRITEVTAVTTVSVEGKTGWIVVSFNDPRPGQPILDVVRSDGSSVGADHAWRSDGKVHFIDDPVTTYDVVFDNQAPLDTDASEGSGDGMAWLPLLLVSLAAVAVVAVVVVVLRRRSA